MNKILRVSALALTIFMALNWHRVIGSIELAANDPSQQVINAPELTMPASLVAESTETTVPTYLSNNPVYKYGVYGYDQYGTPIPKVQETQPAQPWIRSDGWFNYCYLLPDGSWTTVTGKIDIQPGVYYYGGPIDPATQAAAYADQSEQWCKDNAP